ncbi:helix-turn-helix domain-containing protein [Kitasatospora sp. HPMI-4]|uniref:helix-turn-helix domain-containing protein n=1 Tax=Kitasatospora sp. HPMI-4 TaxID=3448443 RepID=UPI003F1A82FF
MTTPTIAPSAGIAPELLAQIVAATIAALGVQPATDNPLRLYTPEQTADLLGMTPYWVEERVRAGTIPHKRLGRFVRFSAAQIAQIGDEIDPATRRARPRTRRAA